MSQPHAFEVAKSAQFTKDSYRAHFMSMTEQEALTALGDEGRVKLVSQYWQIGCGAHALADEDLETGVNRMLEILARRKPAAAPQPPPVIVHEPAPIVETHVVHFVDTSAMDALREENERLRQALAERDAPSEPESVFDGALVPPALRNLMEDDETISQARLRLWPILNDELATLKNQEALFGKSIPRRAEVESLIGILAMVGES
jgi:hypothetical protein